MKRKLEDIDPERDFGQWEKLIDAWIFNEEDRKLLKRYYLDGITHGTLAEESHMDIDTVKKRIYKASEKLFKHI